MATDTRSYDGLMHAGGGTVLMLLPLSAMIPGLLPFIGLLALIGAVIVLPLIALTLVAAVLAAPPVGLWLLTKRIRARRADARRAGTMTWQAPVARGPRDRSRATPA